MFNDTERPFCLFFCVPSHVSRSAVEVMIRVSLTHTRTLKLILPLHITCTVSPAGWRSSWQSIWLWAFAHHPARGQSHHTQKRRRVLFYRRWQMCTHTHTHLHISTSASVLIHYSYTTHPNKCFSSPHSIHPHLQITFCCVFLHAVDGAAEAKPRKEGALIDSSLSPVPEAAGGITKSAQTQTQAPPSTPPPSTPPPSSREKVRWMLNFSMLHHNKDLKSLARCIFLLLLPPPTKINRWTRMCDYSGGRCKDKMPDFGFVELFQFPVLASVYCAVGVIFINLCKMKILRCRQEYWYIIVT